MNAVAAPNLNIDLHTHTTASDGALSPRALIDLAAKNNTDLLAITDHDTVAGYDTARDYAKTRGIKLITGVEVSTTWQSRGIHIVGLNFVVSHAAITSLLQHQAAARQRRAQIIVQKLNKAGLSLTLAEVQASANSLHIGRPHIARALVEKGEVASVNKAFKKYLGSGKIGDVKSGWVSLSEAVAAINASGGVAVVAHPNHYQMTRTKLLRLLDEFIEAGGQGIEVISGKQHRDITQKYAQIATDKGLYASMGSDFHGHFAYAASIGQLASLPDNITPIWTVF
ncbi:MAG: phosphatase [Gammaproteobacteria bacterium]|nr:MAG: phosphatase [Gammaproteobacteria bacterium]